jgi:hypothetical protein
MISACSTSNWSGANHSPPISGVVFHWDTHERRASGSDNWPITWADDDHQYSAWGDGGGFVGSNNLGRTSLGFAKIVGGKETFRGENIWGGYYGEQSATFGGKSYGIVSIDGTLYAWWGPGSGTAKSISTEGKSDSELAWASKIYERTQLLKSTDKGKSWQKSNWSLTDIDERLIMPTILNYGRDYDGARDSYVYHYIIRKEPTGPALTVHKGGSPPTGKIDLARVPATDIMDLSKYEFYAGLDEKGMPEWSVEANDRAPIFEDANGVGWNLSVSHNAGLNRYFLITEHSSTATGRMGMFSASEPWGPWRSVAYFNSTAFGEGTIEENTFFWNFSNKWLSDDGRDFVLIFSGHDSNDAWNSVHGTFLLDENSHLVNDVAPNELNQVLTVEESYGIDAEEWDK